MAPTGTRGGCPVCRTALDSAPAEPIAERRCPRCEAGLWALALPSGPEFFVRRPGQSCAEFITALAGSRLGLSERDISSFLRGADALDIVEFLEELTRIPGAP
jgi:hypothetical protein